MKLRFPSSRYLRRLSHRVFRGSSAGAIRRSHYDFCRLAGLRRKPARMYTLYLPLHQLHGKSEQQDSGAGPRKDGRGWTARTRGHRATRWPPPPLMPAAPPLLPPTSPASPPGARDRGCRPWIRGLAPQGGPRCGLHGGGVAAEQSMGRWRRSRGGRRASLARPTRRRLWLGRHGGGAREGGEGRPASKYSSGVSSGLRGCDRLGHGRSRHGCSTGWRSGAGADALQTPSMSACGSGPGAVRCFSILVSSTQYSTISATSVLEGAVAASSEYQVRRRSLLFQVSNGRCPSGNAVLQSGDRKSVV